MISILIIDDEPKIVNSMEKLMRQLPYAPLQVYKAYSAAEAIECLQAEKIHVVLSDIKMPGISGIELQREIVKRWPLCKVVFLTGYSDFDYVQSALRNGAVDFLTKTEDNETILAAVMKAVESVTLNDRKEAIIKKGQDDLRKAQPILQKEWLGAVLNNEIRISDLSQAQLDEVQIPLSLSAPVIPCFCKVDEWQDSYTLRDKLLMNFAITNIAEEILGREVHMVSYSEEPGKRLWILQPRLEAREQFLTDTIQPALEAIQEACRQMLHLKISLVIALEWVNWEDLSSRAERLKMALSSGFRIDENLLIQLPSTSEFNIREQEEQFLHSVRKLSILTTSLEEGNRQPFFDLYSTLRAQILSLPPHLSHYKIEIYYSLGLLFLSYLNKWNMRGKIEGRVDLTRLYSIGFGGTDKETLDYFSELAQVIFDTNDQGQQERNNIIVEQVNRYIHIHLMNDLSLHIIGDAVGYNPSYLSRVYKHLTGVGIAEYILTQRLTLAKSLLKESKLRVGEIAAKSGFMSEAHFFRIFKKTTGMTPAEYRDLHVIEP
ncbi:response regulator [Cohnella thailandensis]|uniref:Response regulator n=1 Tax=Cohnella thailandensis TaxID=557557 RepID=A0A841T3I3_9BACL|nr:response regulator [Cohnella thailandensis]MBB6637185.1 response regulator [Cohnella thailandensis]MBP1976994.1 two-component system response regulator YesN [Cohnella thailandensis]